MDNQQAFNLAPGSPAAIAQGCTCPRMDNCHGEGFVIDGLRQYWIAQDCPLHGWKGEDKNADSEQD